MSMLDCIPQVSSFLCCLGLSIATKIIALLHIGVSLTITVICIRLCISLSGNVGGMEDHDGLYSLWYKAAIAVVCLSFVHVMLGVLLLYGAAKRKATLVRTWVIIMSVLLLAAILYNITVPLVYGLNAKGVDLALRILIAILFFGVLLYFIITVNSYYIMLKYKEEDEKQDHEANEKISQS